MKKKKNPLISYLESRRLKAPAEPLRKAVLAMFCAQGNLGPAAAEGKALSGDSLQTLQPTEAPHLCPCTYRLGSRSGL